MRRVLVPIDSSENATRALRFAIKYAKEHAPVKLHIVNAHEPPIIYGEVALYLSEEKVKELQRKHSEDILKPAVAMAKAAGIDFESHIFTGDIAKSIVKGAEELGCDAILMGSRGMGAIGNLVMGSVATKVIHLTKLPVTLIK